VAIAGSRWSLQNTDERTKDFETLLKGSVLPQGGEIEIAPYSKEAYYADLMRVTEGS